jgi:hypothetical protein
MVNFLEPSWPLQACNGTALPLPYSCLDSWFALRTQIFHVWTVCSRLIKWTSQFLFSLFIFDSSTELYRICYAFEELKMWWWRFFIWTCWTTKVFTLGPYRSRPSAPHWCEWTSCLAICTPQITCVGRTDALHAIYWGVLLELSARHFVTRIQIYGHPV